MAVSSVHPKYANRLADWQQLLDTFNGERAVKEKGQIYLPATSGMIADGLSPDQLGYKAYDAYKKRAVFHHIVKEAVEACVGLLHKDPARIELPDKLKPLLDSCTKQGDSLQMLLRKINEWQFLYGRCGLLVEVPDGGGPTTLPYIAPYDAMAVTNWGEDSEFVILREIYHKQSNFDWAEHIRYRVCVMMDGTYLVQTVEDDAGTFDPATATMPSIAGNLFQKIPFVFVNTNSVSPDPEDCPFLGISNLSLAIYRGEADYRQALFQQAQETLVIIGGNPSDEETRVGAGAVIHLPKEADAKYIGVSSDGLTQMKESIEADKSLALQMGAKIIDEGSSQQSGEALRIRMASKTANLKSIAQTGGEALQQILRYCAEIVGANPEEVIVEPCSDFTDSEMTGQELLQLVQAKSMGAPISTQTIHMLMRRKDMTELSYEEEVGLVENENIQ